MLAALTVTGNSVIDVLLLILLLLAIVYLIRRL